MENNLITRPGEVISESRKSKGLSQEELAELSGVSLRTIQRVEKNNVTPQPFTLKKIATALELKFESFQQAKQDPQYRKDISVARWMILSCLILILPPINNIIVPLLIWFANRKNGVMQYGRKIISFQIIWTVITAIFFFLTPSITYLITGESNPGDLNPNLIVYLIMVSINVIFLLTVAFQLNKGESKLLSSIPSLV